MPEVLKETGWSLDKVTFVPGTGPRENAPNSGNPDNELYEVGFRYGSEGTAGTPYISANMESVTDITNAVVLASHGVMPIIHQFMPLEERMQVARQLSEVEIDTRAFPQSAVRPDGRMLFGMAVGFRDMAEETIALFQAGAPLVRIDSANGYTPAFVSSLLQSREARDYDLQNAQDLAEAVKEIRDRDASGKWLIFAGNVATGEGAQRLANAGAHAVVGGIASGTACGTWNYVDVHVPQGTALEWMYPVLKDTDVMLISDGGARDPGTAAVALAFAQGVMMGGVYAATTEAPNEKRDIDGVLYANYQGSASTEAREARVQKNGGRYTLKRHEVREGFSVWLPVRGTTQEVVEEFMAHLVRVMWYVGVRSLDELREYAKLLPLEDAALDAVRKLDILRTSPDSK